MEFQYFAGEQRTKPWYDIRLGKPTASRLEDWLSTSKAAKTLGQPLKKRLDYEKELIFEQQFGVAFENYINSAMEDGILFEQFVIEQYEQNTGRKVTPVGAWYNDKFCASPDGGVEDEGLVEAKVLRANSFTDVLTDGVPPKYWKQCQGELFASKRQWCDFVAANLVTKKIKVIRVLPDKEFHQYLELALLERLTTPKFDTEGLYDFVGEAPEELTQLSDSAFEGF